MKLATTIAQGICVAGLGVAIAVVDRAPDTGKRAAEQANVLVRFDEKEVNRITVERNGDETVLQVRGGLWFLTGPVTDRADRTLVEGLLDQLNHLAVIDSIPESEWKNDQRWDIEQLGLDEENAIRLTVAGKTEREIVLGGPAPREDSLYALVPGGREQAIRVVEGNPRRFLENAVEALRDRRLVAAPPNRIVELSIRDGENEVALGRRVTPPLRDWSVARPIQAWADEEKMDDLLATLAGLRIEDVIAAAGEEAPVPDPLPDNAVVVRLRVVGVEEPVTLYLRELPKDPDHFGPPVLEARISDRPFTYRVRSSVLDTLVADAAAWRDRGLARIPIQFLRSITIESRSSDPLVHLRAVPEAQGTRWSVRVNDQLEPAHLPAVTRLVEGVNGTAILDFVSESGEGLAAFGLAPPSRRVTFEIEYPGVTDERGNPGEPQRVLQQLNLGWKAGDEQRLFASFEGEPSVYELDPSFVGLFATHPIKWRSLQVLSLNAYHVESIVREKKIPERETLSLTYDYTRDEWEAERGGVDIRPILDVALARSLRDRLASLVAADWYLSLATAYEALENEASSITIGVNELDRATGESSRVDYRLAFAKATEYLYFGKLDSSPDVFLIDVETYKNLMRPVTAAAGVAAP